MGACFMHRFIGLIARFRRDERGAFAVMFGLMAIVLIAMGGAVVDYVTLEQTRGRAQIALDAAALALQPEIFETPLNEDDIRRRAQALLIERIGEEWNVVVDDPIEIEVNVAEGSLYLRARVTVPTMFVTLVGVDQLSAQIQSEATRQQLALEVVMVLDNSGSMLLTGTGPNGTRQRIQFLKDAAKCATNILFFEEVMDDPANTDTCIPTATAEQVDNVNVGIVPFTMFVNVGAGNRTAAWIDQTGASVTSNDNFDNDDDEWTLSGALPSRLALFTGTGESWRGCVEARPHISSGPSAAEYLDTDDTLPTGGNTLFVPLFSPDLPDNVGGNNYIGDYPAVCDRPTTHGTDCTVVQRATNCNAQMNNQSCRVETVSSTPVGQTNFSSTQKYAYGYYGAHASRCDCRVPSTGWTQTIGNGNNRTYERTYACVGGGYIPGGLSDRERQERICKYFAGVTGSNFSRGPNADCTRTAILPLTDDPSIVNSTITGMIAEGGTNIHEGAAWGFRAISPDQPFTEGAEYDRATSKVVIIMTDGENTAYNLGNHCTWPRLLNGSCYNSAYGFPYNSKNNSSTSSSGGNIERLGPSTPTNNGSTESTNATLVFEMNERTRQTCENMKAQGIRVYTIGLATSQAQQSSQADVHDMLSDCATTRDGAYFPQTPGELKTVFESIAGELSALRLAQ